MKITDFRICLTFGDFVNFMKFVFCLSFDWYRILIPKLYEDHRRVFALLEIIHL